MLFSENSGSPRHGSGRRLSTEISLFDFATGSIDDDDDSPDSPASVKKVPIRQYRRHQSLLSLSQINTDSVPLGHKNKNLSSPPPQPSRPKRRRHSVSNFNLRQVTPYSAHSDYKRERPQQKEDPTTNHVNIRPFQDDFIVEKAKESLLIHEEDLDKLLIACEQMATAQRLADLATQRMAEALTNLHCNGKIKKRGGELAKRLKEENRVNSTKTDMWQHSLLDVLDNVKSSYKRTASLLEEKYNEAKQKYDDFHEKHPDCTNYSCDESEITNSSYSTDEESSGASISSMKVNQFLKRSNSLSSVKSSIISMFNFGKENHLKRSKVITEEVVLCRNDFLNAVEKLKSQSSKFLGCELKELIKLYSPHAISPYQPTQSL